MFLSPAFSKFLLILIVSSFSVQCYIIGALKDKVNSKWKISKKFQNGEGKLETGDSACGCVNFIQFVVK
jgi:hypothetical protein